MRVGVDMKTVLLPVLLVSCVIAAACGECAGATDLIRAARYGDAAAVKLLMGQGAKINERDGCGMTALMYASQEGHAEIVGFLIENGADVSAETGETARYESGVTALLLATVRGHAEVANILKRAGTSGEKLWKYMVIVIWILLWSGVLSGAAEENQNRG